MKETIFKNISLTTVVIIFLYLSGGLYLGVYWFSLGVDPTNLVTIAEIPKNFFRPFFYSVGLIIFAAFIGYYTAKVFIPKDNKHIAYLEERAAGIHSALNKILYIFSPIFCCLTYVFRKNGLLIIILGFLFIGLILLRLLLSKRFCAFLKEIGISRLIAFSAVFTPMMSLLMGLYDSANIQSNVEIKILKQISVATSPTNQIIKSNQPLKLLGFLGDKLIISSLDDKKVFILNQSAFEGIELEEYKK